MDAERMRLMDAEKMQLMDAEKMRATVYCRKG